MRVGLTWRVLGWEFRLITRGIAFWLAALAASLAAIGVVREGVLNPHLVAAELTGWAQPVIPLLLLPVLGAARRRDERAGVHELVHSRPVGAFPYLLGKFLAGWAAAVAAWLLSLAVTGLALAWMGGWATLLDLPEVAWRSAWLALPSFALVTAFCLAADALTGRAEVVLGAGGALVLTSLLYIRGLWASLLLPLILTDASPVFGYGPYTATLLAVRGWGLALTAGLLAVAIYAFPRRTPALAGGRATVTVAALVVVAVFGGTVAVWALAPAPPVLRWREAAQSWELDQVRAAAADRWAAERYWSGLRLEGDPWPVEVWVSRGSEAAAEELARHVARLLPQFPGLQPPGGQPFRLFEGSYLRTPRLEGGSLVSFAKEVKLAPTPHGLRSVLRAMAEAYWAKLARIPEAPPQEPFPMGLNETWAAGPALYHQWLVLEEVAGRAALEEERGLWERYVARESREIFPELMRSGRVGYSASDGPARQAAVLWELGQEIGHDTVLAALVEAAGHMEPVSFQVWRDPDLGDFAFRNGPPEEAYWSAVSERLEQDLTQRSGWPRPRLPPVRGRLSLTGGDPIAPPLPPPHPVQRLARSSAGGVGRYRPALAGG